MWQYNEKTMEEIQGRNAVQMQDMPHKKGTWQGTLTCRPLCRACEICYLEVVGSRVTSGEVKAVIGLVPAQITNWIWSR
jgi:hypothetical protein